MIISVRVGWGCSFEMGWNYGFRHDRILKRPYSFDFSFKTSKFLTIAYFQIKDRIFSENDRKIFPNDRVLSSKIVYFQSRWYTLSHRRITLARSYT